MNIKLNNNTIQINQSTTIQQLVEEKNIPPKGIAVAINNSVVAKANWSITTLKENDHIIIITATQGG